MVSDSIGIADTASAAMLGNADVYKAGRLAARLTRTSNGVVFAYRQDYLASGGPPVATSLPPNAQELLFPSGAVPPYFAGLLPEGRRLSSLVTAVKTSADDELSLLLRVGSDPVGDVQVMAAGASLAQAQPVVDVGSFNEVDFHDILRSGAIDPIAIAGAQDKLSVGMISMPLTRSNKSYILKLNPPDAPHTVANETYFLDLARRSRLPVAHGKTVYDANGVPGLLVERFDRVVDAGLQAHALPLEDAAQVLRLYPADKYNVTAESAVTGLASKCAAQSLAARRAFSQLCFAWLTGNGDVHAKNLSILGSSDNEWQLAPAYDLPCTLFYGDKAMALSIGGSKVGLSRRRLLAFASSIGVPQPAAIRALDQTLKGTSVLESELADGALPFGPTLTKDVVRQLRRRRRDALTS